MTTRIQTSRAIALQDRMRRLPAMLEPQVRYLPHRYCDDDIDRDLWDGPGYYWRTDKASTWTLLAYGIGTARARVVRWEREAGIKPQLPTVGEVFETVASVVDLVLDVGDLIRR